ncbi:hypothetical protein [Absidia glauca]|uniref:Uncharacterized protein n=1 Tax=Absidia glauca TaxID=4829 RepID=A0A163MMB9_ABSGL|nr:hypothetical protein [Absidia glauca]
MMVNALPSNVRLPRCWSSPFLLRGSSWNVNQFQIDGMSCYISNVVRTYRQKSLLHIQPPHIYNSLLDSTGTCGIKKPRLPMDTITKTLNIIQDVSTNTICRDEGIMQLIGLDLPPNETKFVKPIIKLMGKLPRNSISNDTQRI